MRSGLPEGARLELLASRDTQERIAELEQRAFELGEELARRGEELEAVRQLNGELMAKVSLSRPKAFSSNAHPSAARAGSVLAAVVIGHRPEHGWRTTSRPRWAVHGSCWRPASSFCSPSRRGTAMS